MARSGGVDGTASDRAAELVDDAARGHVDHAAGVIDVVACRDTQVRRAGAADVDDAAVGGTAATHQIKAIRIDVDRSRVVQDKDRLPGINGDHAGGADTGGVGRARCLGRVAITGSTSYPISGGVPVAGNRIPRAIGG